MYDPLEPLPDTNIETGNYTTDKYDALEDENASLRKTIQEQAAEIRGLVNQQWVKREDYDALRARVEEIEAERDRLRSTVDMMSARISAAMKWLSACGHAAALAGKEKPTTPPGAGEEKPKS